MVYLASGNQNMVNLSLIKAYYIDGCGFRYWFGLEVFSYGYNCTMSKFHAGHKQAGTDPCTDGTVVISGTNICPRNGT